MPLRAVICDAFNTLFRNEISGWIDTFGEICRLQGHAVPPQELYDVWKSHEMGFRRVRNNLERPELSPPFKTYRTAWMEAFVDAFRDLGLQGDPQQAAAMSVEAMGTREPFDDTMQFLERAGRHWRISLLTNADDDFISPLLERYGLSFHSVVTSESAQAYKPAPMGFLRVLRETGVSPEETVYVGDTPLDDVHGARLLGERAAWLNRSGAKWDDSLLAPDYEVSGLEELERVLESQEGVNRK